ncbi:spherulation-specific family 4 protein [Streptomyces sp. NPDC001288]|uniref:spherulation-specific family 4 protein n=1 Tax=Streptomyces sp. NPDC001297 TaxID=3364559 RepID=UPI0036B473F6
MSRKKRTNRKWLGIAAATGCAAAAAVPALLSTAHGATTGQTLAVPAYLDPGSGSWKAFGSPGSGAGLLVANPNSGPGSGVDASYTSAISGAHQAGVKVIGYVDTGYFGTTGRTVPGSGGSSTDAWLQSVEKNVDAWYAQYGSAGLGGIFFDDALNSCGPSSGSSAYVDLYKEIRDYVKAKDGSAQVVINPGAGTDQCYEDAADTVVTFEGSYADYQTWQPQPWEKTADSSKIWHLVYDAGKSQMSNAISLSKERNAGYVYVTDDAGNPWDTVASYWAQEVAAVGGGAPSADSVSPSSTRHVSPSATRSVTPSVSPSATDSVSPSVSPSVSASATDSVSPPRDRTTDHRRSTGSGRRHRHHHGGEDREHG